jgi:hypothetical protein
LTAFSFVVPLKDAKKLLTSDFPLETRYGEGPRETGKHFEPADAVNLKILNIICFLTS